MSDIYRIKEYICDKSKYETYFITTSCTICINDSSCAFFINKQKAMSMNWVFYIHEIESIAKHTQEYD
jgi:hypothetical protein